MGLSLYARNSENDHVFRVASFTMPAGLYAALFLTDANPGNAAGTTPTGTEASYTGYARQAVTMNASSGGVSTNSSTVTFPANSGGAGGTANYFALFDSVSGGKLLGSWPLAAPIALNSGTSVSFAAGQLSFSLT